MLHEILLALFGNTGSIIIELPLIEQNLDFARQMMLENPFDYTGGYDNNRGEQHGEGNFGLLRFMVNPNLNFLSRAEID